MNKNIILVNGSGQIKEAPAGNWNFYVLFFNFLVPLYRRDWKWFFLGVILSSIFWLIGTNQYNFWYIKDLLKKGYKIKSIPPSTSPEFLSKKIGLNTDLYMI